MLLQALCIISYSLVNSNWSYSPETTNLGQIRRFLEPCDLEIWEMTLKNNMAPLLCYFKLLYIISYSLVNSNWSYSPETPNLGKNRWFFFSRVTLQFDGWPSKTIGHLFHVTSSFVHNFVAIGDLKLQLQSGTAQFGSNSTIFRAVWPWNLRTDLEKQYVTSSMLLQALCIIS